MPIDFEIDPKASVKDQLIEAHYRHAAVSLNLAAIASKHKQWIVVDGYIDEAIRSIASAKVVRST